MPSRLRAPAVILWAATLALGAAGGFALDLLHVPLAWLLGSLGAVAAAGLCGIELSVPPGGRQVGQLLLGTAIGLTFTAAVAEAVAGYAPVMILAALLSITYGVVAAYTLRRSAKVDDATAFFASVPGGVAEMSILAERNGGETAPVSLAQSLRILCVVITIPPVITVLGLTGVDPFEPSTLTFDPMGFGALLTLALAGGGLLAWRKVPNAWLLGPMAVAVLITVSESHLSSMPTPLLNLSQVLIGATLGLRYRRDRLLALRRFLPSAVLSTVVLVGLNVATGALIGLIVGIPVATMALAVSPGGMAEMSITAKVLHLGVPIVSAFHVVRIFLVIGFSETVFRRMFRRPSSAHATPPSDNAL
ncbi:AbrB family transcriptional regulator [Thalassobaculum sp.]|uniref:AbrB family transcriptional regulator n=1 Tax=Thalassobaculum sp. TaxID=2022740 RepID=UPI0032EAFA34